jgi:hypothetical protein
MDAGGKQHARPCHGHLSRPRQLRFLVGRKDAEGPPDACRSRTRHDGIQVFVKGSVGEMAVCVDHGRPGHYGIKA